MMRLLLACLFLFVALGASTGCSKSGSDPEDGPKLANPDDPKLKGLVPTNPVGGAGGKPGTASQ